MIKRERAREHLLPPPPQTHNKYNSIQNTHQHRTNKQNKKKREEEKEN